MSITSRAARRTGVLAAGVCLATAAALAPANAASYVINYDITCHVYEQVQLQGSPAHDYMRWYSSGASNGCEVALYRQYNGSSWSAEEDVVILTTGTDAGGWFYDGPGWKAEVLVWDRNGHESSGPVN